jgi:hypothetical protein
MPHRTVWIAALMGVVSGLAQELPPGTLLLARVEARVRESLAQLPDCTCVETIRRFERPPGANPGMQPADTIRLQILFSGDHELYAVRGGSRWESNPGALVGTGLIGNGIFALHLKMLFVNRQATFVYRGAGADFQPSQPYYDFKMPVLMSGYSLSTGTASGIVGLKGKVWVDPESFDVVRLEMHADDIPPELPFEEVTTIIDYTRVRIGSMEVLLPRDAITYAVLTSGQKSRNEIEFTNCNAFHAETTLRFDAPAADGKKQ